VSRRTLLVGGTALVLGCGKDDAAVPPPRPESALLRQLAAERELLHGLEAGRQPRLAARSRARSRRIAVAITARGGRLHDAPLREEAPAEPPIALARAALAAHVAALPDLAGRDLRRLGSELVEESAADLAVLGARLGERAGEAFPGTTA
jgi:hypothetical protein